MEQVLTAVYITMFIMMGSALFVFFWEAMDSGKEKKWKIDLGEKMHQEIVDFLGSDNNDEIKAFVGKVVGTYLKEH
ncbi:uncharacterized protein METZ01_LOCUS434918 [marine metagenome]|uniref:Uncharacterized protein n=1 Tax=marine metagenome TaxID=408172 RepID=A0A382YFR8_9ZZZZ